MADDEAPATSDVDDLADQLYALEPEQFVPARDRFAKDLRRDGDITAAKALKALRRPTVAAWAVNQLVRRHEGTVDELLEATAATEMAQRQSLAGKRTNLRGLSEQRQKLIDELLAQAEHILEEAGRSSPAHQDDIVRSLQASSDPDLARQLRQGRLVTALEPVSSLSGLTAWFEDSGAAETASKRDRQRRLEQTRRQAEQALAEAERDVQQAESDKERLRRDLAKAARRIARLTQLREQRRVELEATRRAMSEIQS